MVQWMRGWAWGLKHSNDIVQAAKAVSQPTNQSVKRLAAVRHERNSEQVIEAMLPMDRLPSMLHVEDRIIDTVILPEVMFKWLLELDSEKFKRHIGYLEGGMAGWWAALGGICSGARILVNYVLYHLLGQE